MEELTSLLAKHFKGMDIIIKPVFENCFEVTSTQGEKLYINLSEDCMYLRDTKGDHFKIDYFDDSLIKGRDILIDNPYILLSPIKGKIVKAYKEINDHVEKGEVILKLEAMKMEIDITAKVSGIISKIPYKEGSVVNEKEKLVFLKQETQDN